MSGFSFNTKKINKLQKNTRECAYKNKQGGHLFVKYNLAIQEYKGIRFRLIKYTEKHFARLKAKRFLLIPDNKDKPITQNFWIPNVYLEPDGTLKTNANIDFVFKQALRQNKFKHAGIPVPEFLIY